MENNNNDKTTKVEVPVQETIKDRKKVAVSEKLAESNRWKRKEREWLAKAQSESKLTCYGAGPVIVIGTSGILGYYVYQSKKTPQETLV